MFVPFVISTSQPLYKMFYSQYLLELFKKQYYSLSEFYTLPHSCLPSSMPRLFPFQTHLLHLPLMIVAWTYEVVIRQGSQVILLHCVSKFFYFHFKAIYFYLRLLMLSFFREKNNIQIVPYVLSADGFLWERKSQLLNELFCVRNYRRYKEWVFVHSTNKTGKRQGALNYC